MLRFVNNVEEKGSFPVAVNNNCVSTIFALAFQEFILYHSSYALLSDFNNGFST